jgi:hypothetical protein
MASRYPPYQHSPGRTTTRPAAPGFQQPPIPALQKWASAQRVRTRFPSLFPRIAATAAGLAPLTSAAVPFSAGDTAGGAPPPGYGDLLSQLLAGLMGPQQGLTPEEGLAQARRALIQYGGVPPGLASLHELGNAFDSGTSALARANTTSGISVLARLNQAHADQNRYIQNRLAAHGILDSGETGFQAGREQTNYARAQADSAGKLLDYLSGINSGIAQYQQWQAMMDALRAAQAGGPAVDSANTGPAPPPLYTGPGYGGVVSPSQSPTFAAYHGLNIRHFPTRPRYAGGRFYAA